MVTAAHLLDLAPARSSSAIANAHGRRGVDPAQGDWPTVERPDQRRCSGLCITLVRERYADFGPTLTAGKLAERAGLRVSREALRSWMVDAGLWLSREQRRTFHQPWLRREAYGEQVQIAGSMTAVLATGLRR